MGKTFVITLVPVLGGAMLGAAPVAVLGSLYVIGYNLQFLEQADF